MATAADAATNVTFSWAEVAEGRISFAEASKLLQQFTSRSAATAALSVGIVVGASFAASAGMLLWYNIARHKASLQGVYHPRRARIDSDLMFKRSQQVGGLLPRLGTFCTLTPFLPSDAHIDRLIDFVGIDACAFLLYYRMCASLLFCVAAGGLCIAFIDWQSNGSTRVAADLLDALGMIRLNGPICWVHLVLAVYSSLCSVLLTSTYYSAFTRARMTFWKRASFYREQQTDRTWIMVRRFLSCPADRRRSPAASRTLRTLRSCPTRVRPTQSSLGSRSARCNARRPSCARPSASSRRRH